MIVLYLTGYFPNKKNNYYFVDCEYIDNNIDEIVCCCKKQYEIVYRNLNGKYHRLDGPAIKEFYSDGTLRIQEYYVNDELHRLDGPAFESFYPNGILKLQAYYVNELLHRIDGPAISEFYPDGTLNTEQYFIDHVNLSKKDFLKRKK